RASLVLGAALLGFAGVAAAVLRDPVGDAGAGSAVRRCVHMVRLASRTYLSLLYGLALGGLVAVAVYLPAYLTDVFGLRPFPTLAVTAVVVVLASLARLAGGWWTDRHPTARALLVCYAVAAGLCLVVALAPRVWWLTSALVAGVAICDGLASGALLALIGKAARPESTGAVMGVTGAVAAFGPVCLSLLLAGVEQLTGSYVVAWFLLAVVLLAVAWYVYLRGLQIGLGLAVRHELSPSPAAMTIAVVGEAETRWGAAAVVARLAELAARDELVVVYGSDDVGNSRRDRNPLVVGLRDRLPRYRIEAIPVRPETGPLGADAAVFDEFVATGAVAVAVTPTPELGGVAAQLSTYLQADRVLKVSYTLNAGARLHKVWDRRPSWTPADSG
ncbi:MAG TPA: MFS transporter, partial [Rugosimonospora sp.]|nr:MFS transporter [Rugosimonospora sp.]